MSIIYLSVCLFSFLHYLLSISVYFQWNLIVGLILALQQTVKVDCHHIMQKVWIHVKEYCHHRTNNNENHNRYDDNGYICSNFDSSLGTVSSMQGRVSFSVLKECVLLDIYFITQYYIYNRKENYQIAHLIFLWNLNS